MTNENARPINLARQGSVFFGALAPDVQGLFPDMIAVPDDELNDEIREAVAEQLYQQYAEAVQFIDDRLSGFWSRWKPADRLALYEKAEPVFIEPMLIPYWLQAAEMGMADAGDLLRQGGMFQQMWMWEPKECTKMLRDYASLQKERDSRQQPVDVALMVAS